MSSVETTTDRTPQKTFLFSSCATAIGGVAAVGGVAVVFGLMAASTSMSEKENNNLVESIAGKDKAVYLTNGSIALFPRDMATAAFKESVDIILSNHRPGERFSSFPYAISKITERTDEDGCLVRTVRAVRSIDSPVQQLHPRQSSEIGVMSARICRNINTVNTVQDMLFKDGKSAILGDTGAPESFAGYKLKLESSWSPDGCLYRYASLVLPEGSSPAMPERPREIPLASANFCMHTNLRWLTAMP